MVKIVHFTNKKYRQFKIKKLPSKEHHTLTSNLLAGEKNIHWGYTRPKSD